MLVTHSKFSIIWTYIKENTVAYRNSQCFLFTIQSYLGMIIYYSWMFKSSPLMLEIFQIPCVLCKVSGLGSVLGEKKDQEKCRFYWGMQWTQREPFWRKLSYVTNVATFSFIRDIYLGEASFERTTSVNLKGKYIIKGVGMYKGTVWSLCLGDGIASGMAELTNWIRSFSLSLTFFF